jgi:hypothetical protein
VLKVGGKKRKTIGSSGNCNYLMRVKVVSYEKEKDKQGRDLTRITGDKEKTESLEHRIEREGEWMRM